MKHGDFTELAQEYKNRAGYSQTVLDKLVNHTGARISPDYSIIDVGAGTGKLTEGLCDMGFTVTAVEPNAAMRQEGEKALAGKTVTWMTGTGEDTGLPSNSVDWVLMASSFHWVDFPKGIAEFHRILKDDGYFTCLWNPRAIQKSPLHSEIEKVVYQVSPKIERISSGARAYTEQLDKKLVSTGHFVDCVFMEADHDLVVSKERYMGAWRSVNDIQTQAGPEAFQEILSAIENVIADTNELVVPYTTRAWTVKKALMG